MEDQIHKYMIDLVDQKGNEPSIVLEIMIILKSNDWSLRLVGESLSTLRSLSTKTEEHRMVLLENMSITNLAEYIQMYEDDVRIQTEAHHLIECFTQ